MIGQGAYGIVRTVVCANVGYLSNVATLVFLNSFIALILVALRTNLSLFIFHILVGVQGPQGRNG
jgi:hypothetical protein